MDPKAIAVWAAKVLDESKVGQVRATDGAPLNHGHRLQALCDEGYISSLQMGRRLKCQQSEPIRPKDTGRLKCRFLLSGYT